MNEKFNKMYDYLSENKITDLSPDEFYSEYKEGEKFDKLYGYLKSKNITDLDNQSFQQEYFPQKKNPIEQIEPLESSMEEPSMDIPEESGLGESPSNLETYNNRIKEANMKFANTPVKEEAPTEEGFLDSFEANAQKRAGDRDSYRKLNTLIPGLGNTTALIDQAYNSAVNVIPAAIKTSLSAFVNNDFSNLSQKVAKAKSEGKSEIEVNMWEQSLFQSFDPRMINPLADAPKDRKVRERKEGDPTTFMIPLDEAESKVNELKKQVISTVVDVENANIESSKFQDPSAEYSDMFTPIGFMSNLGQMIPQVGVSVVAPYIGSYAQIYGDTYQSTVREIAAKKFRVELQDVTPKMMIDVIEKGEDKQAVSAMSSTAGAALDYIGVGKLTGAIKGPFSGLMRNTVKKGLQNGGKAGVAKALKKTGDILSTAAFEGVTEGGQSVIQQFGTGIALDKTISQSFNGINWDQVLEEGTAGALGGGPFGAMNSSRIKFNSNDVEAMIAEGDIGAIRQFTQEGFIDWRTIPNKTRSKIGFTQQEYEGNTYRYPNTILSPETPQTNEQTTKNPTGVPSMDEGSESNVNQIDEQDGLTAQEPTDIERRSKEPKTLKEADESIYDLYTVKDGDTEVEGSLSVDEGGKAEITTKDGKIYEVGNVNDNTSLKEAGVTFTKSGVEPLGNSQFNVDGKKVTLRSDHQFKLGKKGTTVTVYDENNKPIKLKGKQAEELEYFSALEKAENQLEETNQTLSEDEEFQNENITRPKETTKGETTVLPKQGTESDSEAERDVVDDLLSPVTEEDIEQEEKPVSQVQKEKSELIESKGGKLIDENTESEGILPTAIKATKSITSEDGTPTKFYVVETQEEFDSILDESGITDPEELKLAKQTNNAFFDPSSQTVVYNKSKINDTTEIHEVVHPVLESYMVNNKDQVDQMAEEAISNDISLLEFIEPYEGSEKSLEAVVEGIARAAQADFDNKGSVRIRIKDFFDNLLEKAGFNRDVVIKGDETYVQLSRKLSDAFRRGRKIVVSNKAKSDGKIKNQKNQNRSKSSEYTKEQLAEIEELQENSDTTQRANTVKSYEKAAKNLSENEQPESVLDYGAGLGLGTDAMSEVLGIDVDSYEPNTRKWQGSKPVDYKKAEDIDKKYDSVVSLNVVNVVPKGMRDFIIKDIFDSLNEGGVALISSRPWSGDIATTKYFKEGPEEKSILVKGVKDGEVIDVYQKGFDKNELVDYAKELLGPNAKVTKDTSFGKMAIKITKVADGVGVTQKSSNPKVTKIRRQVRSGKKISKGLKVYKKDSIKVREEAPDLSLEYVRDNAPVVFIENAKAISQYDIIKKLVDFKIETIADAQKVYDLFSREIADNLKFLIDNFDPENRDFATLWYDGANVIAHEYAKQYKSTPEQVAGIIASLSPQKDWYQNVRLAELVLIAFQKNPTLGQSEIDYQININKTGEKEAYKKVDKAKAKYRKSRTKANKAKVIELEGKYNEKVEANTILVDRLSSLIGSKLSEVPNEYKKYFIRTFNEVNTTKDYNVLNPDGTVMGVAKNTNGKNSPVAWGSYTEIGKAVSVYLDGSARNITESLGEMHKIRNFYNNIIDPMSEDGDVTMDTHAVAAALLKAVSGNSEEVSHNFGTNKTGSSIRIKSSAPNGIKGIYYAFQEGYKLAGKENNLLPRQVQSITWENIRSIFTKTFKNKAKNVNEINKIWLDYTANKIDIDEARKRIVKYSGGFKLPTWARSGAVQERSGKDTGNESDRGGSLRDGQSTVGTSDRRDERGERSGIKFQKSPPTNSKQFKQWFGDSKVVEPNGTPSLMYHGTKEDFEEFDSENGIFFTNDKYVAQMYSEDAIAAMNEGTETIVPAYLRIESPLDLRVLGLTSTRRKFVNYVKSISGDTEFNPKGRFEGDLDDKVPVWEIVTDYNGQFYDHLDNIGYDGVYLKDENDIEHESYIVWNANQAKHAAENNGDWSRNDSRLRFQKSVPKDPSIAKVRDFILDNEKILSEDVVYKSLKGEGVDEITVNQYRSIIKRLIDSTKKVNRKLQENGYKTKEEQRKALKGNMNSYAEEIATLNDFLQSVAKIDRLKKVFQNLDTVRKFYKKGKLAEHWEKAGFLTNPNYVNPEKLSDNLFNKYSNLLNTLAKKLKRGTITYREIMAMDNFRLELYKENESLELDNIAGLIATKSGVNELASMSDSELEDFFERISKEEGSAFVFQQHHIDLFKNNKERMLQLISEINNIDSTIDIENDEDRFSIPVGDRQRLWEVASKGVNEYRMAEMEGISLEEYVKDYLSENLMPADLVMLGEKVDNYTYIIKKGNYYNTRNDLFSELKSEIKRTDNKKSVGNIISDREKKYARTILSIDNQNDLLNFENYEIKHLINSVRAIREANWLPPVAATQNRKINGIRKSIILSEEFLNNNIESILNDVEKFIPSFETAIRDAVRKGVNAEGLKGVLIKKLNENVGIAKLGRMKSKALENFMNEFDAALESFNNRIKEANTKRSNLFMQINRNTNHKGANIHRQELNVLIKMLQVEQQYTSNQASNKVPKLSKLIQFTTNYDKQGEVNSEQYQDYTANKMWKLFGNKDNTLNIAAVNALLKKAKAEKYIKFLRDEAQNNQSIVLHNAKYRRGEAAEIYNNYTPIVTRGGDNKKASSQERFNNLSSPVTVKSKTSMSRTDWDSDKKYRSNSLDWDSYGNSAFAHSDANKDYYLSESYLDAYSTLSMLRGRLNESGDVVVSALQNSIEAKTKSQLTTESFARDMPTLNILMSNIKRSLLSSFIRPVQELTGNAFMAFSAWPTMVDVAKGNMMPGADMGLIAEIFNTSAIDKIKDKNNWGPDQKEQGEYLLDLNPNPNAFMEQYQKLIGSKITGLASTTIGFADKTISLMLWRAKFPAEFKRITGTDWNRNILDDENITKVYEDAIQEAVNAADMVIKKPYMGSSLYQTTVPTNKSGKVKKAWQTIMNNPIMRWFTGFRRGQAGLLDEAWSVVSPFRAPIGAMGKAEARRTIAGLYAGNISYGLLSKVITDVMLDYLLDVLVGEDDDDEFDIENQLMWATENGLMEILLLSTPVGKWNAIGYGMVSGVLRVGNRVRRDGGDSKDLFNKLKRHFTGGDVYEESMGGLPILINTFTDTPISIGEYAFSNGSANNIFVNAAQATTRVAGIPGTKQAMDIMKRIAKEEKEKPRYNKKKSSGF